MRGNIAARDEVLRELARQRYQHDRNRHRGYISPVLRRESRKKRGDPKSNAVQVVIGREILRKIRGREQYADDGDRQRQYGRPSRKADSDLE